MVQNFSDGLQVRGAFQAGNMEHGVVVITPVANTPTTELVTGMTLAGSGAVYHFVTAYSQFPETRVVETSMSPVDVSSFDVTLYRTNTSDTWVNWFTIRRP